MHRTTYWTRSNGMMMKINEHFYCNNTVITIDSCILFHMKMSRNDILRLCMHGHNVYRVAALQSCCIP